MPEIKTAFTGGKMNKDLDERLIPNGEYKDALNILLVDSENPVEKAPWVHLKTHDSWDLKKSHDEHCHLMVQCMEAWIITDVDVLKDFYGGGFNESILPDNPKVEEISKSDVETSLKKATRNTQKGEYHKINHGPKILGLINVNRVRTVAPHCDRLFTTLTEIMSEPS